jgi:hypothetical protein
VEEIRRSARLVGARRSENDPRWVKLMADTGLTEAHARAQAWRKAHPPEKPAAKN